MATDQDKILQQQITELPFSEDFKIICNNLGFKSIADIAAHHVSALIELDGFTYHILQEFTQFMQQNNLSHLIKQH